MSLNIDHSRKIIFDSGPPYITIWVGIAALIAAIGVFAAVQDASTAMALVVALFLFVALSRQWTVEFDTGMKRLRIFRKFFGRWTRTKIDCPFNECAALGIIEYNHDGHTSFGAFCQLKNGYRHAIPLKTSTFTEASETVAELSSATGISDVRLERQRS